MYHGNTFGSLRPGLFPDGHTIWPTLGHIIANVVVYKSRSVTQCCCCYYASYYGQPV